MMAEILQLAQLVELHRVAEVQVGPRRVEALLDGERLAARELCPQLGLDEQLVGAAFENGDLVVDVEGHGVLLRFRRGTRPIRRPGILEDGPGRGVC